MSAASNSEGHGEQLEALLGDDAWHDVFLCSTGLGGVSTLLALANECIDMCGLGCCHLLGVNPAIS
jgi:hypothetical protein